MTFSLSVDTVYFCCAAIPPVPPGKTHDVPAAEPHRAGGGTAHADAAAKPMEKVKISTALPVACSLAFPFHFIYALNVVIVTMLLKSCFALG